MISPLGRLNPQVGPHFQDKLAALIRQEKPSIVVETGLETGFGAEYILKALDDNGHGRLYSIDPALHAEFIRVPLVHPRFTFIQAKSQDALESLFKEVGPFDIFVHDSDHSAECQYFEYEAAWRMVRPGGIIATDDPWWGMPPHRTWSKFLERHGLKNPVIIGNAMWIRRPA